MPLPRTSVFTCHPLHKIEMSRFLTIASLLLCLLNHGTDIATAWDDRDFFSSCPPIRCSKDGPEIRFPLRLESSNSSPSCGATPYMNLTCSGQDTILQHPFLGPSKVTALDYINSRMGIIPLVEQRFSECPIQKLISLPDQAHAEDYSGFLYCRFSGRLVDCSREVRPCGSSASALFGADGVCGSVSYYGEDPDAAESIAGPFPCLSEPGRFTYLVNNFLQVSLLPLDCKVLSNTVVPIPFSLQPFNWNWTLNTFKQAAEAVISSSEIRISWEDGDPNPKTSITDFCTDCENQGQPCAFSSQRNQPFCVPRPQSNKGTVSFLTDQNSRELQMLHSVFKCLLLPNKHNYVLPKSQFSIYLAHVKIELRYHFKIYKNYYFDWSTSFNKVLNCNQRLTNLSRQSGKYVNLSN